MLNRITLLSNLEAVILRLNRATGSPERPYVDNQPQALCWHIGGSHGGYQLRRISGKPGSTGVITHGGYGTKREIWDRVHAMLDSINAPMSERITTLMIENPFHIQRGAICVIRAYGVNGWVKPCAFQITPRANWREWTGAFSLL